MSALARILAVAAFEFRLARRMIRVWIFGIIAIIVSILLIAHRLGIHYYGGGWSGSYAYMTKDLAIQNSVMFLALALSVFGIFYVFDWRHRETDARFADTFDTSPLTRLEHAWGKFLGICGGFVVPFLVLLPIQIFAYQFWDLQVPVAVYFVSYFVYAPVFLIVPVALAFGLAGLTGSYDELGARTDALESQLSGLPSRIQSGRSSLTSLASRIRGAIRARPDQR